MGQRITWSLSYMEEHVAVDFDEHIFEGGGEFVNNTGRSAGAEAS